jgi:hypothetical protein
VISLVWRAEDYGWYTELRRRYPDDVHMLVAPEFLLPAVAMYKALFLRLTGLGIIPKHAQQPPAAFIGVLFLLQVSQQGGSPGYCLVCVLPIGHPCDT